VLILDTSEDFKNDEEKCQEMLFKLKSFMEE